MALSIETVEADELAWSLARERARRQAPSTLATRVSTLAKQLRAAYDARPVSRAEWDAATD